ncbi:uncharacterized protein LOC135335886 isoform X2 [Halichondria panicea]|uniref:uncharacterized protein LOC135335886 isoform X2 n=1 Tax=Halichondria panicea TaxID=6063 RepID=UPI00312BA9C5
MASSQNLCCFFLLSVLLHISLGAGDDPTMDSTQCPPLPEIANGVISYSPDITPDYDVGTMAIYLCENGFVLSGDDTRDCQSDGTFSGMEPVCSMTRIQVVFEIPERTELETAGDVEVCVVVVEGVLAREVIVTVASRDGSALAGEDYEQFSVDLSFDPDTNRACFTVTVTNDDRYELPESFDLVLTSNDDFVIIDVPTSVFNINDEDVLVIGFPQEVYDVTEDIGDAPITVQIISGELADGVSVDIFFSNQNVTVFDGSDYTAVTRILTFTSTITSIPVPVRILDDMVYEDLEIFLATLNEASLERITVAPGAAIVNIADEDVITIGFVETGVMVSEGDGNAGLQVAVISGMLDAEIQVQVTTRYGSASSVNDADYSSVIQPLTFTTTTDVGDVSVLISEDGVSEPLENFFADLSLLTNTDRVTIAPTEATITIEDNDVVWIGFEREMYPAFENVTAMICARLLPNSPSLDHEVVVTIRSSGGTATAPADYNAIVEHLIFGPGVFRVCVEVLPVDDGVVEGLETFNVTLTSDDDVVLVSDVATVVIQELDMVLVMFERPMYTFTENGITSSVVVVKTGVTDQPFSVQVIGGPSTQTDVVISASGFNEVVTFEAGPNADNSIIVQFTLIDDDIALEAIESYIGSLDIVGNPEGVTFGMVDTTTVNVRDDDVVTVIFDRPELTVDEDVGNFTMCVTLDRVTLLPVTVTIEARDGSAVFPGDINSSSIPTSLTIPAGATSACFEGMIVDNTIVEDTESFTLVITGVTPEGVVIGGDTTVISIIDNEVACDAISAPPNSIVTYNTEPVPPFPAGASAMFECVDGFSPVTTSPGESTKFPLPGELILLECGEIVQGEGGVFVRNGTSSQVELDCTRLCDNLPPLFNGMITYNTSQGLHNTVATYTCNDGFTLLGSHLRICEEGVWEEASPSCLQDAITPSGAPMIGQSISLLCTVTETDSLQLTISYYWFRGQLPLTTNSGLLTFDTLFLSDAGLYRCEVTVSSDEHTIIVNSSYEINFKSLHIQLRLIISSNCGAYTQSETAVKTSDITNEFSHGVNELCQCGFNTFLISRPFIRCFENSPNHVTYRAVLSSSQTISALIIGSFIDQWSKETPSIIVQSAGLRINSTCPVIIANPDSPECPEDLTNRTLIITANTDNTLSIGAVIGIVIGSLALILALLVAVILLVALRYRIYKSKTLCINESNPPHLDMKPEIVLDELPDHDYDYISVFQEADLKSTTGNPQPSTAGDDASEVQIEQTSCDTYEPVTIQPMQDDIQLKQ